MSQYMLASMVPSMNSIVPAALMQPRPWHSTTMLDFRQDTLVFVLLTLLPPHTLGTIWTKYVYFGLIGPQHMAPVIHVLSLQQTICELTWASSLEEASFWDDNHADQFDAVCGVWSEHWPAYPPPLQPLQQCWQQSYLYFPNTTSGYDAEHVYSTSLVVHGEACSEWNLSC